MAITQTDIEIALQKRPDYDVRIDLLDTNYDKIAELQGEATSLTWNISADSDIRRTANLSMHILNKRYLAESHEYIWLNRIVQLYVGLNDSVGTRHWYLCGSFLISDSSYVYDESNQTLTLPLVDMMACTTEKRGSKINGYGLKILAGTNIRTALISVITDFTPYHQYSIPEFDDTIPYDLEFGIGIYPFEALSTILSLYPQYEMFYSVNGVFTVAKIPTGYDDELFVDESFTDALTISETHNSTFSDVRNTTEIIGRSLTADYTAQTCTTSGNTYTLFIADTFEVLEDGALYGFTPDSNSVSGQRIKIQDTMDYGIYLQGITQEQDTPIAVGAMTSGIPYCVKYANYRFYLQGELEIHAIIQERNYALSTADQAQFKIDNNCRDVVWIIDPSSPFAVEVVGEVWDVKSDGEYANIYTTALAIERGYYENWMTTRLQNTVTLTMSLVPWMDVNKKISHTNPISEEIEVFMVQSVSYDYSSMEMTLNLITFYPYLPWI